MRSSTVSLLVQIGAAVFVLLWASRRSMGPLQAGGRLLAYVRPTPLTDQLLIEGTGRAYSETAERCRRNLCAPPRLPVLLASGFDPRSR